VKRRSLQCPGNKDGDLDEREPWRWRERDSVGICLVLGVSKVCKGRQYGRCAGEKRESEESS
jgi:hypothetical protein